MSEKAKVLKRLHVIMGFAMLVTIAIYYAILYSSGTNAGKFPIYFAEGILILMGIDELILAVKVSDVLKLARQLVREKHIVKEPDNPYFIVAILLIVGISLSIFAGNPFGDDIIAEAVVIFAIVAWAATTCQLLTFEDNVDILEIEKKKEGENHV